ncbi:hypothetical protein H7U20_13475 [Rugamonas sp. CCM 8940]|nr:hypothetical protein [Rugamonas sp. CCM 8940]MBJ7311197.1 hypothetical protein [Rugamonas sp. CCM 8940]
MSGRQVQIAAEHGSPRMGVIGNERVKRRKLWLRRVPPGTQANVRITLARPTVIGTVFGADTYTVIALALNEPGRFVESLQNSLK